MQDRKRWYVRRKPVSEMLRSVYRQKIPLSYSLSAKPILAGGRKT